MKQFVLFFICIAAMACNSVEPLSPGGEVDDVMPRDRVDIKLTKAQKAYVTKGNDFAFNLFREVMAREKGSFMISPLSVEYALAMLCNGAAGTTQGEILGCLGFSSDEMDAVNEYCKYLTEALYDADNTVKLNLANAMVSNTALAHLKLAYVSALENWYDALVKGYDFSKDNTAALSYINGWAKEKTYGMIPSVLDELSPSAYLILMNAIYFKGAWNSKNGFSENDTKNGDFTTGKGGKIKVAYMNQESRMSYASDNLCQIVSLPYGNGAFAMDVLVPHEGVTVQEVAASLKAGAFPRSYPDKQVKLKLPRFETENDRIELVDVLKSLGIKSAFSDLQADFSKMTDDAVFVSDVFQKTKIKVNEKGSEAAAVTVGVYSSGISTTPPPVPEVYATRPFVYAIHETSTGAILFMGAFCGN
jgi:serpin B